ncbi:hypothetical protein SBBP1_260031 [Burkholderiales bacterium]|nr:hypothetical protein SBBP1_260031 [Burkholderiales bacterium]
MGDKPRHGPEGRAAAPAGQTAGGEGALLWLRYHAQIRF